MRFYSNSNTINIAEIRVRNTTDTTGKPAGTLFMSSGQPVLRSDREWDRSHLFLANNEWEASVIDGAGAERNRIELTDTNLVIAQRASDGDLTHRIETTAAAWHWETFDPTLTAGSLCCEIVMPVDRDGLFTINHYGSITIQGNRLNQQDEDVTIAGGNATFNLAYDASGQRVHCQTFYDRTSAAAADMHITSAGTVTRSTSASKYKINIVPQDFGDSVLDLTPVTWYDKQNTELTAELLSAAAEEDVTRLALLERSDIEPLRQWPGLIAEEVAGAGLEEFVNRNDGEIEGIAYDRLWIPLIPIIKDLRARVGELEAQLQEAH
jgi:hypothetical protein